MVSNLLVLHHTNRLIAEALSALQSSCLCFSFSSVQRIPSSNPCMIALVLLNLCILLYNGRIFFLHQLQWIILSSILRGHLCSFRTWIIFLQCILTLNFSLRNQLSWDIYLYLRLVPSCSFQYSFFGIFSVLSIIRYMRFLFWFYLFEALGGSVVEQFLRNWSITSLRVGRDTWESRSKGC